MGKKARASLKEGVSFYHIFFQNFLGFPKI